jgi:integrase
VRIPDKYIPQGYFADVSKEKTIRKGEYRYRAVFAIWDGQRWHPESSTKGLTTRGLADEWLDAKVKALTEKGADIMLNPETVSGFTEAHYKPYLKNHKKIQYKFEFRKLDVICEFLGKKLIDEVSKLDVFAFKTWLMERPYKRGKSEQERSEASAHRYLSRLRGLLNFAEEVGKRKNHISFKDIIEKESPKTAYISFEEFLRVLDACYEIPKCNRWKRDRSHMRLTLIGGYTTGLRINELRNVTRRMILTDDLERRGVIKLGMPDARNKIHTKTVDISTWLYDEMQAAGVFDLADDATVFNTTNYYNLVKDLFARAGVSPDVTFHTLRAANATERDTAGQDRESLQVGMGHAKGSGVTERHYLRHQDYHIIEKGAVYNDRLERLRREHGLKRPHAPDDVLDAETLD